MKKTLFKIVIIAILVINLTSVAAYADTLMDILNNLVGPRAQYNTIVSPTYMRENTSEYYVNPQSGEMVMSQTDYSLPGRNGLDLEITRLYKSGSASRYKNSVKSENGVLIDYLDNTFNTGNSYGNTFYELRYNLGCGFRFSFPTIELSGSYRFLHTESGDVYRMVQQADDSFTLENHPVKDIDLRLYSSKDISSQCLNEDETLNQTLIAGYVMTEKNGKKTYLDSEGRIIRIVDRYQNQIAFDYVYHTYNLSEGAISKVLISKITDTLNRVVTIEYKDDPTFTVTGYDPIAGTCSSDLQHKFEVVISLPNNKKIVYDKAGMAYNIDTLHSVRQSLERVYDVDAAYPIKYPLIPKYRYYYEKVSLGFTFFNGLIYPTEETKKNVYENIKYIDYYKTNQIKEFSYGDISNASNRYVKPLYYDNNDNGSMEYRKVKLEVDWSRINDFPNFLGVKEYSYINEPEKYTYNTSNNAWTVYPGYSSDQNYLRDTYRYYTQITDSMTDSRGAITKYTYNGLGENISIEESSTDHKIIKTITNDANKLPKKAQTVIYDKQNGQETGKQVTKTENYVYDIYGNLLQYTGPEAVRDSNTGEPLLTAGNTYTTTEGTIANLHTAVYTYYSGENNIPLIYHMLKSKTWKKDATTTARIEYDVNTAGNITQERRIHPGNNILTDYIYDTYGNMTRKSIHYANNTGNTYVANYEYGTDTDGVNHNGAYLTKEYNVLDGAQIAKNYVYDFNTGNLKAKIDEKGNRINYQYDIFDRLTNIFYPDGTSDTYGYTESTLENKRIYFKDRNTTSGYRYYYTFDIYDNLVDTYAYQQYNGNLQWCLISRNVYDRNGNKIKVIDANGHSIRYSYDLANRLVSKSFWENDTTQKMILTLSYTAGYDSNTPLQMVITNEEGYVKQYNYDILDRLYKLDDTPVKSPNNVFNSTLYVYDYVGNNTKITDCLNHSINYTYDDLGRLISQKDALNNTTQYGYDANNMLIAEYDARNKTINYDYDLLGRPIRKKVPATDGTTATTRYIYDVSGNLKKVISPKYYNQSYDTAALAETMTGISYTYDSMNRQLSTVSPEGTVLEYKKYDANGNIIKVVDGLRYNGNIDTSNGTVYSYDVLNRVTDIYDALNQHVAFNEYDMLGRLIGKTDARNNRTQYAYNSDGTLWKAINPDTSYVEYVYDKLGHKITQYDQLRNMTTFTYDGYGNIKTETDAKSNIISYEYYDNGNLKKVTDKRGNSTEYEYYDNNLLKKKKVPIELVGSTVLYYTEDFAYDGVGNLTCKTYSGTKRPRSTRNITNTYYDNNLLKTVTDSSGRYIKYYYDKNNNVTKEETLRSIGKYDVIKSEYDNRNREIKSMCLIDEADIYNASSLTNIANIRDSEYVGKVQSITGYEYDLIGNLTKTVDSRAYGYLATDITNRSKYSTNYAYDILNRLQMVTTIPNGTDLYKKYFYDAVGNKKAEQNERGYYKVYTYDSLNRVKTATDSETDASLKNITEQQIINLAGAETNSLVKAITYEYNLAGNVISITNAKNYKMKYGYDALNRQDTVMAPYDTTLSNSSTNPYSRVINKKVYDENGNVVKEIDAKGYLSNNTDTTRYGTAYTYDLANRLVSVLDPECKYRWLAFTIKYEYNQFGEKTKQTDVLNNVTNYEYNDSGKLNEVIDPLLIQTSYAYDKVGNKLTMTDGRGKITRYAYGAFGKLNKATDADLKETSYQYDLALNPVKVQDRNMNTTLYTYDPRSLLLSKSVTQTGDGISYTYDGVGNRLSMGTNSYSYDANNRLKNITRGGATQISYTYDILGNILMVTDKKGFVTTYTYDTSNRMKSVKYTVSGKVKTTTYNYDNNGNRGSIVYHGGLTETYTYNKNNKILTLTNKMQGSQTSISSYIYTYYNNGLQHTKTDSYGQSTYTYDGSGRITGINAPGKTTLYTYDASGNRVSMSETYTSDQSSGFTQETGGSEIQYRIKSSQYMYSNANKLLNLVETMKDVSDIEVLEKTTKYLYDNNGNQLNQKSSYIRPAISVTESVHMGYYAADSNSELDNNLEITDNVYDGFNRLKKVDNIKKGSRVITEFTYDGDDLRVSKTVKSSSNNYQPVITNYLYDRQHVILETDASDNVKVRYIRGINYIARVDNSNNFSYYLYNGHGDVVQTVAEDGTVENQYEYDIFGNMVLTIESYSNSIRYAGEFMDESTGLYYLRARYYDSYTGRFISEDSYWGEDINPLSLNLYTYCYNNPISFVDPTGHVVTDWDRKNIEKKNPEDFKRLNHYDQQWKGVNGMDAKVAKKWMEYYQQAARNIRDKYRDINEFESLAKDGNTVTVDKKFVIQSNGLNGNLSGPSSAEKKNGSNSTKEVYEDKKNSEKVDQSTGLQKFVNGAYKVLQVISDVGDAIMINDPIPDGSLPGMYNSFTYADDAIGSLAVLVGKVGKMGLNKMGLNKVDDIILKNVDDVAKYSDEVFDSIKGGLDDVVTKKIPWGNWNDYKKVTVNGQEYAQVGDRLYSKHAVDRMQPSGNLYGHPITQAGGDYGRSVAPQYVEDVIKSVKPVLQENGNLSYISGSLQVITNKQGAVVTIITKQ